MLYSLPLRARLTVGSAAGAIRELFTKVQAIDAKHGKFDLVLCTGDFFGPPKGEGEEYTDEDDVMQLLNGALDGEYPSLCSVCVDLTQAIQHPWNASSCKVNMHCRNQSLRSSQKQEDSCQRTCSYSVGAYRDVRCSSDRIARQVRSNDNSARVTRCMPWWNL